MLYFSMGRNDWSTIAGKKRAASYILGSSFSRGGPSRSSRPSTSSRSAENPPLPRTNIADRSFNFDFSDYTDDYQHDIEERVERSSDPYSDWDAVWDEISNEYLASRPKAAGYA